MGKAVFGPQYCPHCQTRIPAGKKTCWFCDVPVRNPDSVPRRPPPRARREAETSLGVSSLVLLVALIVVCLGVVLQAAGIGIPMIAVLTPIGVFLGVRSLQRQAEVRAMPFLEQLWGIFASVLAVVIGVPVLLGLAAFVSFFAFCGIGGHPFR